MKIENFGVFKNSFDINFEGKVVSIIGENGTGKSTILYLLRFILDEKTRKKGLDEKWIQGIEKDVKVEFTFNVSNTNFLSALPIVEKDKIFISMTVEKDSENGLYEPIIRIGKIEKLKYSLYQKLPFDDYIDTIYFNPYYENNDEAWINKKFENKNVEKEILSKVSQNIEDANNKNTQINEIKNFNQEANVEIKKVFKSGKFEFNLLSNIETGKLGKALKFFPVYNNKKITTHGSGFEKIFSMVAKIKANNNEGKETVLIIDELENHLFYTYQRMIIDYLVKLNILQIIVVTHSPNVITLIPDSSITKLRIDCKSSNFYISPSTNYYYYQIDLFSAVFYENILMVEGHSEKLFYEYLLKNNDAIKRKIADKNIFVMNIQGIDFKQKVELLMNLSKNVFILTDNDIWFEKYMGIKRIYKLIQIYENDFKFDEQYFDYIETKRENNESKLKSIIKKGVEYKIYTQSKYGETFEWALLNEKLLNEKDKKNLEKAKLKNLSKFLPEISKKINEEKINSSEYLFVWLKEVD